MWQRAGIILRIGRYFGKGDVPRPLDETPEVAVGDRRAIHPETANCDAMDWRPRGNAYPIPCGKVPPGIHSMSRCGAAPGGAQLRLASSASSIVTKSLCI